MEEEAEAAEAVLEVPGVQEAGVPAVQEEVLSEVQKHHLLEAITGLIMDDSDDITHITPRIQHSVPEADGTQEQSLPWSSSRFICCLW